MDHGTKQKMKRGGFEIFRELWRGNFFSSSLKYRYFGLARRGSLNSPSSKTVSVLQNQGKISPRDLTGAIDTKVRRPRKSSAIDLETDAYFFGGEREAGSL